MEKKKDWKKPILVKFNSPVRSAGSPYNIGAEYLIECVGADKTTKDLATRYPHLIDDILTGKVQETRSVRNGYCS